MTATAQVLIAEDNDIDAERVTRCATRAGISNLMIRALDGQEALEVLRGEDTRGPLDPPHIVLLDLNMPRMNGLEFLSEVRNDPKLADTPVIILTTSEMPADVAEAQRLRADGYLNKPITPEELREVIEFAEQRPTAN